ncbi:hypothetical protein SSX86_030599 [Deinandra increscens subsp. villosa]|uniref:Uncharacterized protein n=1 Tax=Deinandra increscens subsp. villosa TaxID=3103831 RepID=A0AAP0GIG2_9ASTR
MRLERPDLDLLTRKRISSFSSWLLDIGNGSIGTLDDADPLNSRKVSIPAEYLIPNSTDALTTLIKFIYDPDTMHVPNPIELSKKAIVCPRNDTVDEVMTNHRINQLKPFKAPLPIDIRVIRKYTTKWSPTDKPKFFYLLIDADGTTIEANVQTKRNKLDSHVTLYSCYNIDRYAVDSNIGYRQVVPQTATIVIGDRAVFKPIPELPIPKHYFNFVAYKDLQSMQKQSLLLTDYLCRVESTSSMMKRRDYNLMKISAIDLSGQVIEITLWEDIGYTYVNSLSPGMIVAITSLIVTTHEDKLQLESTSATTVEVEPPVDSYKESMQKLKRLPEDTNRGLWTTIRQGHQKQYHHLGRCSHARQQSKNFRATENGIDVRAQIQAAEIHYVQKKIISYVSIAAEQTIPFIRQEKIYSFSMHKNKAASIQKTLEVDTITGIQEVQDISHTLIATAPATPAAKISRKQATDDPGQHIHSKYKINQHREPSN